jgi:predicted nucleic acid-binding protein
LLHTCRREPFAASVITLGEIFVGAARADQLERAQTLLDQLGVEGLGLPADAGRRLGEIRARSKLRMPDCCVLYAAEEHGAAVATFDTKLTEQAELLGLSVARQSL